MAAPIVQLTYANLGFGGGPLLADLSLTLSAGDRCALIGRNGAGKSTLMAVLEGRTALDAGTRFVQPGTRIGALAQEPPVDGHDTVFDHVAAGLDAASADDPGSAHHRVDEALDRFAVDGTRDPRTLSGGELRRVGLARALVGRPDLLLLDEPTNHLDLPTITALEESLVRFRGALLVVSHDRAFLDSVTNRVLWLDRGRLRVRDAGFRGVEAWMEQVFTEDAAEAARMDKRIASETQWLREGLTARRRRNQGRVRALAALRQERRDRTGRQGVATLAISEGAAGGKLAIEAADVAKAFDDPGGDPAAESGRHRPIIDRFSTRILRGDRVGVIGPNGAGKTTLVRMLIGDLAPDAGTVRLGAGLSVAYFDQRRETLDPDATLRAVLAPGGGDHVMVGDRPRHVASYLKDFLFDPSRLGSPVRSLSGGERNRLLLARLFARPSNLLVLDEPTNDLDLETLELLEDVLGTYRGTLILVSHDRTFLNRLVTSVIAVEGAGRVTEHVGGYDDYLRERPAAPAGRADRARRAKPAPSPPAARTPPRKLSYKDQRDLDRLPGEIDRLSGEIVVLEAELADPDLFRRDAEAFTARTARLEAARAALADAEDRWLEVASLAEALGAG